MAKTKGKATQVRKKTAQPTSKLTPRLRSSGDVTNALSAVISDLMTGPEKVKQARLILKAIGKKISEIKKNPDPRFFVDDHSFFDD
jgi:hypothetical protein